MEPIVPKYHIFVYFGHKRQQNSEWTFKMFLNLDDVWKCSSVYSVYMLELKSIGTIWHPLLANNMFPINVKMHSMGTRKQEVHTVQYSICKWIIHNLHAKPVEWCERCVYCLPIYLKNISACICLNDSHFWQD